VKRSICVLGILAITAACGGGNTQETPAAEPAPAASAPAAPAGDQLDIRLSPTEPRTGDNTFEVMVMQGSQPVTDAEVSVQLFMAAMPSMNMPEMKNTIALKHEGNGQYRGTGNVMMAGTWDATVMVMRGGQHLGDEKLTIVAK
jgi:hypothetical protein